MAFCWKHFFFQMCLKLLFVTGFGGQLCFVYAMCFCLCYTFLYNMHTTTTHSSLYSAKRIAASLHGSNRDGNTEFVYMMHVWLTFVRVHHHHHHQPNSLRTFDAYIQQRNSKEIRATTTTTTTMRRRWWKMCLHCFCA